MNHVYLRLSGIRSRRPGGSLVLRLAVLVLAPVTAAGQFLVPVAVVAGSAAAVTAGSVAVAAAPAHASKLQNSSDQVDASAEDVLQLGLHPAQPEQAHAGRQVGEQVYVTVGAVLAAGYAAEYPQVSQAVGSGRRDQIPSLAAYPAAYRPCEPGQRADCGCLGVWPAPAGALMLITSLLTLAQGGHGDWDGVGAGADADAALAGVGRERVRAVG